jgi:predicted small metal-binding protein
MRRALLCECHLEAWDEEELVSEVLVHLGQKHLVMKQQQEAQVN